MEGSIHTYHSPAEKLTVQEYMSYALKNSKIHNATAMWEKYWGPWQFWSWETKMAFLEQYHSMPAEASEKPIHIGSPHPGYSLPTSSYYTQDEVLDLLHESLKTTYGLTDEQIALLGEDVRFIETDEGGNWQIYHWIYIENQNEVFLVPIMMSIVVPPHTISEGSGIDTNCVTMFMMYEDYLPLLFRQ